MNETQEFLYLGTFKVVHLQPSKLILFQKSSTFLLLTLGRPIVITPERDLGPACVSPSLYFLALAFHLCSYRSNRSSPGG